jgi:hypothetical protein
VNIQNIKKYEKQVNNQQSNGKQKSIHVVKLTTPVIRRTNSSGGGEGAVVLGSQTPNGFSFDVWLVIFFQWMYHKDTDEFCKKKKKL